MALGALLGAVGGAGCMTKQHAASMRTGQGEAMPVIVVRPGAAGRIALMDEYRLHDEMRQHLTRRPHVTIEELPPDEPAQEDAGPEEDEAQPQSEAAPTNEP
jgi:hypothetical protein